PRDAADDGDAAVDAIKSELGSWPLDEDELSDDEPPSWSNASAATARRSTPPKIFRSRVSFMAGQPDNTSEVRANQIAPRPRYRAGPAVADCVAKRVRGR